MYESRVKIKYYSYYSKISINAFLSNCKYFTPPYKSLLRVRGLPVDTAVCLRRNQ